MLLFDSSHPPRSVKTALFNEVMMMGMTMMTLMLKLTMMTMIILTNRMWFSVVCTFVDNDNRHRSGQMLWTQEGQPSESTTTPLVHISYLAAFLSTYITNKVCMYV